LLDGGLIHAIPPGNGVDMFLYLLQPFRLEDFEIIPWYVAYVHGDWVLPERIETRTPVIVVQGVFTFQTGFTTSVQFKTKIEWTCNSTVLVDVSAFELFIALRVHQTFEVCDLVLFKNVGSRGIGFSHGI
jgi:hypothetical protein